MVISAWLSSFTTDGPLRRRLLSGRIRQATCATEASRPGFLTSPCQKGKQPRSCAGLHRRIGSPVRPIPQVIFPCMTLVSRSVSNFAFQPSEAWAWVVRAELWLLGEAGRRPGVAWRGRCGSPVQRLIASADGDARFLAAHVAPAEAPARLLGNRQRLLPPSARTLPSRLPR